MFRCFFISPSLFPLILSTRNWLTKFVKQHWLTNQQYPVWLALLGLSTCIQIIFWLTKEAQPKKATTTVTEAVAATATVNWSQSKHNKQWSSIDYEFELYLVCTKHTLSERIGFINLFTLASCQCRERWNTITNLFYVCARRMRLMCYANSLWYLLNVV